MPRSSPPRRLARPPLLALLLLLLAAASSLGLLSSVAALTREQAEQVDWHRRGLGTVSSAFFVNRRSAISNSTSAAKGSDSILVAAAGEGTIALLEASSGEVVWRKVRRRKKKELKKGFEKPKTNRWHDLNLDLFSLSKNNNNNNR